nr:MFS transporter [Leptospira sp.]
MNLVFFYIAFAFGTLAGSSFLYNIVIYSQTLDAVKGFSGIVFLFLFLPFPLIFLYTGFLLDHFQKKLVLLFFQFLHLLAVFLAGYFDQEIEKTPYLLLGI